ncbi:MAG: HAD-IA family hydrolase [Fimbriimonadaceae bacterium]|nr:HAD-IA family hydrolase [Fimbriimonadaceae bacterium]
MAKIRGVCFDIGGVMIRICHTWNDALVHAGLTPSKPLLDNLPLGGFPEFDAFQDGLIPFDEYAIKLGEFLGIEPDQAKVAHNAILKEMYPGTLQIVRELQAAGLVTGCLSNTNEPHWQTMHSGQFPNIHELKVRLASQEAGVSKPEERFFRMFEEQSGLEPGEILYFEDTLINVEAGKAFGWNAVKIDPDGDVEGQMKEALRCYGVTV